MRGNLAQPSIQLLPASFTHQPHELAHLLTGAGNLFVAWFEQTRGEFVPRSVEPSDLEEYRSYLIQQGKSTATINQRLVALSRFFRWAKSQHMIADSPFALLERVQIPVQQDLTPRWLDQTEQLSLLRIVRRGESRRDFAVVHTLLGAGLLISELAHPHVTDLEMSKRRGLLRVREGRGSKAREIPLNNWTRAALADYMDERAHEMAASLFLGQRGPLVVRGIDSLVRKYAVEAELHDCTARTLRHTFAKNLVDAGTPLDQVAMLLGYESLDTATGYFSSRRPA